MMEENAMTVTCFESCQQTDSKQQGSSNCSSMHWFGCRHCNCRLCFTVLPMSASIPRIQVFPNPGRFTSLIETFRQGKRSKQEVIIQPRPAVGRISGHISLVKKQMEYIDDQAMLYQKLE
jgi:hypothetical protein